MTAPLPRCQPDIVQATADYLYVEMEKLDAPVTYTACLVLTRRIVGRAESSLIQKIEAEAERYAEMYPQSSDGRNTFVIFADWVRGLASSGRPWGAT